jgi:hypothetical protein
MKRPNRRALHSHRDPPQDMFFRFGGHALMC